MKRIESATPSQARQTKEEFANPDAYLDYEYELAKAVQDLPPLYTRLVGITLSVAVFGAIAWAALSKVDEVAVAPGKVLPGEQDVQPVRSLSSGKIKYINQIKVRDLQQVQKGETLIELDSNASQVDIETLKKKAQLLSSAEKAAAQSHKADMNKAQFEYSRLEDNLEFAKLKERKECPFFPGVYQELPGAYREKCKEAQNQLNNSEKLFKIQKEEIEKLKQEYNSEFSKRKQELNSVEGSLKQAQIQWQNQNIKAPIDGTIYNIKVNPSQGTVQFGEELLSVAPVGRLGEELVLEANLPDQYRGFVNEGKRVNVKIETFPYQEFGTVEGYVFSISPDVVPRDNSGKQVFSTKIKLKTNFLKGRRITPGMSARGEIVMREKTVLSLLLDPMTRQVDEVFTQKESVQYEKR